MLWEYSWGEAAGPLSTEIMALGNHRPPIRAEIAAGTERVRTAQLEALSSKYGDVTFMDGRFTAEAMVMFLTGLPKILGLERGVGVDMAHRQLLDAVEGYLDVVEPRTGADGA